MDLKRVLTTVLGLPIVALLFVLGNEYVIGVAVLIVSIISMYEYFGAVKKVAKPIQWVGYLSNLYIVGAMFLETEKLLHFVALSIPVVMLLLFLNVILTDMKITFKDVAYTLVGIMYVPFFFMFLELVRKLEFGKVLFAYTFVVSWSTDIFAYLIGKHFGKHKFSKISPKKSIEGCVAGAIGAVIVSVIYMAISNNYWGTEFSYSIIAIVSLVLSLLSQIGDFVASSVKRFVDVKDYGNLLPGHGGMLDRLDSLVFIAPFLYMIFTGQVGADDLTGPVGISELVSKTTGVKEYLYIMAVVSVSLGITNLLPIPALDGGKILLLLIEAIRRKPVSDKVQIQLQLLGFSLLIALSIFVTYNDISRIF